MPGREDATAAENATCRQNDVFMAPSARAYYCSDAAHSSFACRGMVRRLIRTSFDARIVLFVPRIFSDPAGWW